MYSIGGPETYGPWVPPKVYFPHTAVKQLENEENNTNVESVGKKASACTAFGQSATEATQGP